MIDIAEDLTVFYNPELDVRNTNGVVKVTLKLIRIFA